jgi:hypothetical protein
MATKKEIERITEIISLTLPPFLEIVENIREKKHRKNMYYVFTPFYIRWWHKIKGIKPYESKCYKPKF